MAIIKKEVSNAEVEMTLNSREFNSFEFMNEEVGKIGPFRLWRNALSAANFTLMGENGEEMRISVKNVLIKCAEELAAEIERAKSVAE